MIILALDPSSTNVGYCVADGKDYRESGVFTPQGNVDERIVQIAGWVTRKLRVYQPNVVVLEEPAGDHRNRATDRILGGVSWVIRVASYAVGAKIFIVYPKQVKATRACKDNTRYAAGVAGKDNVGPDEADAIGVWMAYLSGGSKSQSRRQPRIIGK